MDPSGFVYSPAIYPGGSPSSKYSPPVSTLGHSHVLQQFSDAYLALSGWHVTQPLDPYELL
jgi:hypothetical protein